VAISGTVGAEARRESLLATLSDEGQLLLADAVERLDVHPMTIRRDFEYFERAGLARRVRGGIVSVSAGGFMERRSLNLVAKNKIAQKLLGLVPSGGTIGLDSSTTIYCLAPLLPENRGTTIVTNGMSVFDYLNEKPAIRSFLTGGEREQQNNSLVGQLAINSLENFNLDCCFISALSIHSETGTSETTLDQAAMKDAMVRASARTILALDASKLETRSRVRSLTLDRIDVLVTDLAPTDARLDAYRESVKTIL
jgi:DeoR family transcriptional regulator, fructose operon transcriptional repressor